MGDEAISVLQLLRLAPFALATATVLLAAGGLIFGHAYGRYGDDAAISFLLRWRFLFAVALVMLAPALMLVSFGRGAVPSWLSSTVAAAIVGGGMATALLTVGYLLLSVSRPNMFLAAVGRKVTVRRLNRYALAARWAQPDLFSRDLDGRRYRWFGTTIDLGKHDSTSRRKAWGKRAGALARWVGWLGIGAAWHVQRLRLRFYRTDPTELLFDAAAAGLKNGNMRTWRRALAVTGERIRSRSVTPIGMKVVVDNALALEEAAHRQASEDCEVRLSATLGVIGSVELAERSADVLVGGISALVERRTAEPRLALAAVGALEAIAVDNAMSVVRGSGRIGQELIAIPPPPTVWGPNGGSRHPTRALFGLISDIGERADQLGHNELNRAVISACAQIVASLPGVQDRETADVVGWALARAGAAAARRYGGNEDWHGVHDASSSLIRLHRKLLELDAHADTKWLAEAIATIGCWTVANRQSVHMRSWNGRSDMAIEVAGHLLRLPKPSVAWAFNELIVRQHSSAIPWDQRQEFMFLCQQMSGELLGLRQLDEPPRSESGSM